MFDAVSYVMGAEKGKGTVVLEGDNYTFTDDGEGNITITENGGEK